MRPSLLYNNCVYLVYIYKKKIMQAFGKTKYLISFKKFFKSNFKLNFKLHLTLCHVTNNVESFHAEMID